MPALGYRHGETMDEQGQITAKRDAAARARRLALGMNSHDPVYGRMLAFAAALDAEADALERQLRNPPPLLSRKSRCRFSSRSLRTTRTTETQ